MKLKKFFNIISLGIYSPKFTHNPLDFQIQVIPSWFSDKWCVFYYTANGGVTWKTIKHADKPLNTESDDWEWAELTYQIRSDSTFEHELNKFSSYEKILKYEKEQMEIFNEENKKLHEERYKRAQSIKNAYKRINQK